MVCPSLAPSQSLAEVGGATPHFAPPTSARENRLAREAKVCPGAEPEAGWKANARVENSPTYLH